MLETLTKWYQLLFKLTKKDINNNNKRNIYNKRIKNYLFFSHKSTISLLIWVIPLFLRHNVNTGWGSAYDRSSLLSHILSVTKFNMRKPLTNAEANKMDFYWLLQNKGIIIIAWRNVPAKLCLPVKLISEGVQSNKFGKWKCISILDVPYSFNNVTFILCARPVFLWRLSCQSS